MSNRPDRPGRRAGPMPRPRAEGQPTTAGRAAVTSTDRRPARPWHHVNGLAATRPRRWSPRRRPRPPRRHTGRAGTPLGQPHDPGTADRAAARRGGRPSRRPANPPSESHNVSGTEATSSGSALPDRCPPGPAYPVSGPPAQPISAPPVTPPPISAPPSQPYPVSGPPAQPYPVSAPPGYGPPSDHRSARLPHPRSRLPRVRAARRTANPCPHPPGTPTRCPHHPATANPVSAPPDHGQPVSGPPGYGQPVSAPPGHTYPVSAPPGFGPPVSGPPYGPPVSAPPVSAPPVPPWGLTAPPWSSSARPQPLAKSRRRLPRPDHVPPAQAASPPDRPRRPGRP